MFVRLTLTLFCTLFVTWQYLILSLSQCGECFAIFERIVAHQAVAPFGYRLLTPAVIVALGNTPQAVVGFQWVMVAVFFVLLWEWCGQWRVSPVVMLPLFALIMSIMMPTYYFSLYTLPEWNILLCALLLLPRWSSSAHSTGRSPGS